MIAQRSYLRRTCALEYMYLDPPKLVGEWTHGKDGRGHRMWGPRVLDEVITHARYCT